MIRIHDQMKLVMNPPHRTTTKDRQVLQHVGAALRRAALALASVAEGFAGMSEAEGEEAGHESGEDRDGDAACGRSKSCLAGFGFFFEA